MGGRRVCIAMAKYVGAIQENHQYATSPYSARDAAALTSFKIGIKSDPYNTLHNWDDENTNHLCNWTGVECNAGLWRVTRLNLRNRSLEGAIASQIENLSFLQFLDLSLNGFAGHIPASLGLLGRLQQLHLERNLLEGPIPITLGDCRSLTGLHLSKNKQNGSIPHQLGSLRSLQVLGSWGNYHTGIIPQELGNCSMLQAIDLSQDNISGRIPLQLGRLARLQQLIIHENRLTGEIPNSLLNCTQMRNLSLVDNVLYGPIPTEIGVWLTRLEWLLLSKNRLNGSIPELLGNCSSLSHLELAWNELSGIIPPQLGNLRHLTDMNLFYNHLVSGSTATIPILDALSNCSNLNKLDLSYDFVEQPRPAFCETLLLEFGRQQRSRELDLSINNLYGAIPKEIGSCVNLELLDLSYNNLSGTIPLKVASLRYFQLYFNLSHNGLTGHLPAQLGGMQMVQAIDLSANRLSSSIPNQISNCAELSYLNLSHNELAGTLPTSIGMELKSLEVIDLSFNKLSGRLPSSLPKLTMLRELNLSYNNLEGPVPSSKSFRNISFLGNPKLCGEWLGLEKCPYSRYSYSTAGSINKYVILVVSAIAVFVVFFSYIGFGLWLDRCHGNTEEGRRCLKLAPSLTMGYFSRISRQELSRATENFSSRNLLSAGSYGSVYRGILRGGEMVAIKVFTGLNDVSFLRECKTLGQVRHRNLVKILSSCSTPDFKALVLQFMPNGSLEKHLRSNDEHSYSNRQETQRLSLKMRARILCELASAISYLHHDCSPSIFHCDLKPENVLLDESMTAYVADFGIAHLGLNENGEQVETITSTLKGSVGYIAPEHGSGGRISSKGDVYSFGVLLLEMITQKRPTDEMFADGLTLTNAQRKSICYAEANGEEVAEENQPIDARSDKNSPKLIKKPLPKRNSNDLPSKPVKAWESWVENHQYATSPYSARDAAALERGPMPQKTGKEDPNFSFLWNDGAMAFLRLLRRFAHHGFKAPSSEMEKGAAANFSSRPGSQTSSGLFLDGVNGGDGKVGAPLFADNAKQFSFPCVQSSFQSISSFASPTSQHMTAAWPDPHEIAAQGSALAAMLATRTEKLVTAQVAFSASDPSLPPLELMTSNANNSSFYNIQGVHGRLSGGAPDVPAGFEPEPLGLCLVRLKEWDLDFIL
eukprot:Gb_00730 [translate_table: standard]